MLTFKILIFWNMKDKAPNIQFNQWRAKPGHTNQMQSNLSLKETLKKDQKSWKDNLLACCWKMILTSFSRF